MNFYYKKIFCFHIINFQQVVFHEKLFKFNNSFCLNIVRIRTSAQHINYTKAKTKPQRKTLSCLL